MKTKEYLKSFLLVFISILLVGCASTAEKIKMVPYIDYSTFTSSGSTINITEVKGGGEENQGLSRIDNKSFKEALLDTLKRSNLFKEIYIGKSADYELHTEIISQKVEPGISAYAALYVHYSLIKIKTKQVIWSENIFSQNNAFGANQGKDVLESVARDNLAQLIRKLSIILAR